MKKLLYRFKYVLIVSRLLMAMFFAAVTYAHTGGTTLDPQGTNAHATDLADVTCFDDGNGPPAWLFVRIRDNSPPVPDLLVSVHLSKANQAISTTDTVSGDADYSEAVILPGGAGAYRLMVTKTDLGPRAFDVEWHCITADNVHTGTEITVRQIQ